MNVFRSIHSANSGASGGYISGSREGLVEGIGSSRRSLQERMQSFPLSLFEKKLEQKVADYASERLHTLRSVLLELCRLEQSGKPLLEPGKKKISLVPTSGSPYESYSELLTLSDLLRIEVVERKGEFLLLYSHKSLDSALAKLLRAAGRTYLEPPCCVNIPEVLAKIDEASAVIRQREDLGGEEKKQRLEDLDAMKRIIEKSELAGQSVFDPAGKDRHTRKIIKKIESALQGIKDAQREEAEGNLEPFLDKKQAQAAKAIADACKDWPIKPEDSRAIAAIIAEKQGKEGQALLSSFLSDYAEEMHSAAGVAKLQFSNSDLMLMLVKALRQNIASAVESGVPEHRINAAEMALNRLAPELEAISLLITNVDNLNEKIEAGGISKRSLPALFEAICKIGDSRRLLFYKLTAVKEEVKKASFEDHDRVCTVIVQTIEHNLLRTSKKEAELWSRFTSNHGKALALSLGSEYTETIQPRIEKFVSEVGEDLSVKSDQSTKRKIKYKIAAFESEILELIENLERQNPHAGAVIRELLEESKNHTFYKFGGTQVLGDQLCHYLTPEKLLLAKEGAGQSLQELSKENERLFAIFDRYGMSDEILLQLDRLNHRDANAIDSDQDFAKLIHSKAAWETVEIRYREDSEAPSASSWPLPLPASGIPPVIHKITAESNKPKFSTSFQLRQSGPEAGQLFGKDFSEVLFGNKEPLDELLLALNSSYGGERLAGMAYSVISSAFVSGGERFVEMRRKMRDIESDEFLLSFSRQRTLNGALAAKKSEGIFDNEPKLLGSGNSLASALGKSSEEARLIQAEIEGYFRQRIARAMFHEANSRKLEWALDCAERIASQ